MATERYHPLFASDLAAACSYYDSIAETVGNRFRGNVRSIIQAVVERPESFGRIGGEFRGALVHRFPYVVVFTRLCQKTCHSPYPLPRHSLHGGGEGTVVSLRDRLHEFSDRA